MSHGIIVQNVDSRIQIDETYSNIYKHSSGNATATTAYPPSGYSNGDLVLCRAKSDGHVGTGINPNVGRAFWSTASGSGTIYYTAPSSGYEYLLVKKVAGNITPASSGYGLQVFNASGDLIFGATDLSSNLRVLASGVFSNTNGSSTEAREIAFPSASTTYSDLTKIFCLINTATHIRIYAPELMLNVEQAIGYRYDFTSGNAGRIFVCNKYRDYTTELTAGASITYIIMELVE